MSKLLSRFFSLFIFSCLIVTAFTIALDGIYVSAVKDGINLWVACVLPALFPYFFITAILCELSATDYLSKKLSPITRTLFSVNGCVGYALIMSLISGYPIGAKMVSDLKIKGAITDDEAVRASILCSSSSPMFILGSVGNLMFNNKFFGICLFLCHIVSVLIIGLIFGRYKAKSTSQSTYSLTKTKTDNLIYESVYNSALNVITVGGLITIFYLFSEILLQTGIFTPIISIFSKIFKDNNLGKGTALGIIECTRGLKEISKGGIKLLTLPICASICGFGGICILTQSVAFLKKAKIKTAPFLVSKVLSAVINFLIGLIISFTLF